MGSEAEITVRILFFPYLAPGHMIPMVDMAKLFARRRGVKVYILTTPGNVALIQDSVRRHNEDVDATAASGDLLHPIDILVIDFPTAAAGLPDGCDNAASLPSREYRAKFIAATSMLRPPFDQMLASLLPDCVVSDSFFPWTLDSAAGVGVPRLAFSGTGFFSHCAMEAVHRHNIPSSLPPGADSFVIPSLPHDIRLLRSQMADDTSVILRAIKKALSDVLRADAASYGIIVNSFGELEPDYARHYREKIGRAWAVGPVSLCNSEAADKSDRGNKSAIAEEDCLRWLGTKEPSSVVYVSFGSMPWMGPAQLREVVLGLEATGHPFILVARKDVGEEAEAAGEWVPEGFEERNSDKGLIIRGWAPQILILNHEAVGGFVTHCGWNSTLEGIAAGVAIATWPMFADQFYNERLVVDVLGTGVAVGVKKLGVTPEEAQMVSAAEVEAAVGRLMGGDGEAVGRRTRAKELGEGAKRAVEDGGSSHDAVTDLLHQLISDRQIK